MNIVYMGAHAILDYDELRLFTSLGHDVFSLTGYIDPANPHEHMRPAVPEAKAHPELKAAVDSLDTEDNLGAAKAHLPDAVLDWADVIVCAAYEWKWLVPQWDRIREKRVIWRTIGQSMESNERLMAPLFKEGLEIVRYSPKERNIPGYAGESAVIRFAKDPADWYGWEGTAPVVGNITQHMRQRADACGYWFWEQATNGLQTCPVGPGSEAMGGWGHLGYDEMRAYLRAVRCYLYTGTKPASYTLGLIEAMMTGCPVISIGPYAFGGGSYLDGVFEGWEMVPYAENPSLAHRYLTDALATPQLLMSEEQRHKAIDLFGIEAIAAQWAAYLK